MSCAKVYLLCVTASMLCFLLGAYAHEGDIQRACKNNGTSGDVTWRGELICKPKFVLKENV